MKNNEKILHAIGGINDDIIARANTDKLPAKKMRIIPKWRVLVPAAAACLVIAVAVMALPLLSTTPAENTPTLPNQSNAGTDYVPEFAGLPVDNFCLNEEGDSNVNVKLSQAWCATSLIEFFINSDPKLVPQMFVFVRVAETEQFEKTITQKIETDEHTEYYDDYYDMQTSTLQVLSVIRNNRTDIPETITVCQSNYRNYSNVLGKAPAKFLREDAVYLLPISSNDEYTDRLGEWVIWGDTEVLFEVDDNGLIWSHSGFPGFNKFDGMPATQLAQRIVDITDDENFKLADSRLAWYSSGILAQVTAVSELRSVTMEYVTPVSDTESVSEIKEVAVNGYNLELENGDIIELFGSVAGLFELGGRYLVFLDPTVDYPHIIDMYFESTYMAKINDDDTVTPFDENSCFKEVEGCTVEEVVGLVERVKAFYNKY